ncbi:MAG: hypothetical protein H0T76_14315 [Nannocystis sp.]|nr:hypothetical protein [Nannocystis sp.]MBA3547655.1 hypothetical protein [Nannocystis sp.]
MTDEEFLRQHQIDLEQLRGEQRLLHKRLANDLRRIAPLRGGLSGLTGALAFGLGLSVAYQLARR